MHSTCRTISFTTSENLATQPECHHAHTILHMYVIIHATTQLLHQLDYSNCFCELPRHMIQPKSVIRSCVVLDNFKMWRHSWVWSDKIMQPIIRLKMYTYVCSDIKLGIYAFGGFKSVYVVIIIVKLHWIIVIT